MTTIEKHRSIARIQENKDIERALTIASTALLQLNQIPAHEKYLVVILGQLDQRSNFGAVRNWIAENGIMDHGDVDPVQVAHILSRSLISQIEDFCNS